MKKRWKVICKEGLFKFASNIGLARIYYDEYKARGLTPEIKQLKK